ncbi:MAG: class I SAM-dependent methyltransferase [Acidobacteria bacterium]|nr:class I SAM-dependent methyltransferase [Acidobacteriota bacterium]MCH7901250.1 class I SAM-dependent methyltransferase [Acidobacteriota bacterium]TDI56740.1 MAG: methyltransferase domain-containing protein [Acidobacteriota bacterium]
MSEVSDPIFAKIAAQYDRINRILSLGQERKWRARGIQMLEWGRVLDLGSGTGDTDFEGRPVVGIDPVIEMLALSPASARVVAVGEDLPFGDGSFEGVFSGYVFRNLTSVKETLREINRTLKPGSAAVIIDLSRPTNPVLRALHRVGTAIVLPLVGLIFAAAPREYWYLHKSLDALPPPEELFGDSPLEVEEIWRSGFFGFVYGVRLRKPRS